MLYLTSLFSSSPLCIAIVLGNAVKFAGQLDVYSETFTVNVLVVAL